jgi:hypothetical protein
MAGGVVAAGEDGHRARGRVDDRHEVERVVLLRAALLGRDAVAVVDDLGGRAAGRRRSRARGGLAGRNGAVAGLAGLVAGRAGCGVAAGRGAAGRAGRALVVSRRTRRGAIGAASGVAGTTAGLAARCALAVGALAAPLLLARLRALARIELREGEGREAHLDEDPAILAHVHRGGRERRAVAEHENEQAGDGQHPHASRGAPEQELPLPRRIPVLVWQVRRP